MKQILTRIFFVFALCFSAVTVGQAAQVYNIDPSHTYVLWHINHLGFSIQSGKFTDVSGTLTVDEAKPENSKVNVTIPIDKLVTGIPKLDEHLLSEDFLNAKKYPTATFVSNKVTVSGKNTGKVYGTLTLLGVSKPVTLDVKLLKSGMHPITNLQSVGFSATTKIKRSDFGITKYLPNLGDEIQLDIGAEANLPK